MNLVLYCISRLYNVWHIVGIQQIFVCLYNSIINCGYYAVHYILMNYLFYSWNKFLLSEKLGEEKSIRRRKGQSRLG